MEPHTIESFTSRSRPAAHGRGDSHSASMNFLQCGIVPSELFAEFSYYYMGHEMKVKTQVSTFGKPLLRARRDAPETQIGLSTNSRCRQYVKLIATISQQASIEWQDIERNGSRVVRFSRIGSDQFSQRFRSEQKEVIASSPPN
jgi:hypothetical protein